MLSNRLKFPSYINEYCIDQIFQPSRFYKTSLTITCHQYPPENPDKDWVGPAHPVSKLRMCKIAKPLNETPLEKYYQHQRQSVYDKNQLYWEQHNNEFNKLKKEFTEKRLKEINKEDVTTVDAEEMAVFYKQFLNDNYTKHLNYNKWWYKKNLYLVFLALKLKLNRIFHK